MKRLILTLLIALGAMMANSQVIMVDALGVSRHVYYNCPGHERTHVWVEVDGTWMETLLYDTQCPYCGHYFDCWHRHRHYGAFYPYSIPLDASVGFYWYFCRPSLRPSAFYVHYPVRVTYSWYYDIPHYYSYSRYGHHHHYYSHAHHHYYHPESHHKPANHDRPASSYSSRQGNSPSARSTTSTRYQNNYNTTNKNLNQGAPSVNRSSSHTTRGTSSTTTRPKSSTSSSSTTRTYSAPKTSAPKASSASRSSYSSSRSGSSSTTRSSASSSRPSSSSSSRSTSSTRR